MVNVSQGLIDNQFFIGMNSEEIDKIINNVRYLNKKYKKGEMIFQEEDECFAIGMIMDGSIELQRILLSGKNVVLSSLKKGDVFGEALIFSKKHNYPATIIASEDCNIVYIKSEDILKIFAENQKILENFISLLSEKVIMLNSKIKSISYKSVRAKVANYILEECRFQGSKMIPIKESKEKIAEYIGIPRPSLSRELIKFRNKGLISFNRNSIYVVKIHELEDELFE